LGLSSSYNFIHVSTWKNDYTRPNEILVLVTVRSDATTLPDDYPVIIDQHTKHPDLRDNGRIIQISEDGIETQIGSWNNGTATIRPDLVAGGVYAYVLRGL
jgi:hypothetical protein